MAAIRLKTELRLDVSCLYVHVVSCIVARILCRFLILHAKWAKLMAFVVFLSIK